MLKTGDKLTLTEATPCVNDDYKREFCCGSHSELHNGTFYVVRANEQYVRLADWNGDPDHGAPSDKWFHEMSREEADQLVQRQGVQVIA